MASAAFRRSRVGMPALLRRAAARRRARGGRPLRRHAAFSRGARLDRLRGGGFVQHRPLLQMQREPLEPCWMRAERPVKTFLQGLIQIAAGLHHEQNGNRRGAVALVGEGCGKLRPLAERVRRRARGVPRRELLKLAHALAAAATADELRIPRLVAQR